MWDEGSKTENGLKSFGYEAEEQKDISKRVPSKVHLVIQ